MEFAKGALEKALHCSIYIYIYITTTSLLRTRGNMNKCVLFVQEGPSLLKRRPNRMNKCARK